MKKEAERQHYFSRPPTNLDDFKEEVPPLEPNQVNTLDLFLAFHDMIERQKNVCHGIQQFKVKIGLSKNR